MITNLLPTGDVADSAIQYTVGYQPWQALSDQDHSSWVRYWGVPGYSLLDLNDFHIAANQRIRAVYAWASYTTDNGPVGLHLYLENPAGTQLDGGLWPENRSGDWEFSRATGWFSTRWDGGEWTLADINSLRLRVYNTDGSVSAPTVYVAGVAVETVTQLQVTSITLPNGGLTRTPTVKWVLSSPDLQSGFPQNKFQIKVFTAAEYGAVGFDPTTSVASTYDSGQILGDARQWQIPNPMGNGTYRVYIRSAQNFNGADWWSSWNYTSVTLNDLPPVPSFTPVDGATVSTDVPVLTASLQAGTLGARVRADWQIATDAGFTTNLQTISEPTSYLTAGGTTAFQVPIGQQLFQGVWFVRVRAVDEFGSPGAWSSVHAITVAHAPSAIPVGPANDISLPSSVGNYSFFWKFTDPSSVDYQTQYRLVVERNSDGTVILDTGVVLSGISQVDTPLNQGYKDILLRWRVMVWDSDGVASAWSDYATFYYRDLPSVVITSPSPNGATVANPQPTITWTFNAGGGRTETEFRVLFQRSNGWSFDSGWLSGPAVAYTPPSPILSAPFNDYSVTVFVQDNTNLQNSAVRTFVTAWTAPTAPAATIDSSGYDDLGFVRVQWSNVTRDATWVAWRVYRRLASETNWTMLFETRIDVANYEYDDWTPGANQQYEYCVVQVATRFGMEVESSYNNQSVMTPGENYWLIDQQTPPNSVKFRHVTEDSFSEEFEQEELLLIGRGRKTDYGTRWGYAGSLTAKITDEGAVTARSQRLALEALRNQQGTLLLRNPFGDVWQVASGNLAVQRVAGVGQREYVTVTVPYSEQS